MNIRWFRLDDFYETDGDMHVFYPSIYARGYPLSGEDRAKMDSVLEPFLSRQLRTEFIVLFCCVSFGLLGALSAFLFNATAEELDWLLAMPLGIWLLVAAALAVMIVLPVLIRLRLKIKRHLDAIGIHASEPPRPDFFIVEGEFSLARLAYALFGMGTILVLVGMWAG